MSKIRVPKEMLEAASGAVLTQWDGIVRIALEAALLWFTDNPLCLDAIVDKEIQDELIRSRGIDRSVVTRELIAYILTLGQRRMFLAPEPEIPEAIKDLLFENDYRPTVAKGINERIEESYRRGQKAGSK